MPSVKILLRKRKTHEEGYGNLVLLITLNRNERTEISFGQKIKTKHWDPIKQHVRMGETNASSINSIISRKKNEIERFILDKQKFNKSFTLKDLPIKGIKNRKAEGLVDYLSEYIESNPESLRYWSIQAYVTVRNKLKILYKEVLFKNFNLKWVQTYEKALKVEGLKINTVKNHIKILKKISKILLREGLLSLNPFDGYITKSETTKREFLTKEELVVFRNYPLQGKDLNLVRDVFLFGSYTGLRFSDMAIATKDTLKKTNTGCFLELQIDKTKRHEKIRLSKNAVLILEKYKTEDSKFAFPILNKDLELVDEKIYKRKISSKNAKFNSLLKEITKKAGIKKQLSMHCSRHSFATIGLSLGIPIQVVSKMLGHKNIRETQIYSNILPEAELEALSKFDNI